MSEHFVDTHALLERTAQIAAHRVCCGTEHDPANGKLHGYCVVCGVPWPCEYAGTPPKSTRSENEATTDDAVAGLAAEVTRLQLLIDTPEIEDFFHGTKIEAAHQVERWGDAHDRSKSAENWYWLVGYLAGKALRATMDGNREKALHHTISTAAALFQWHKAIKRDTSGAGIGSDQDLQPEEVKR